MCSWVLIHFGHKFQPKLEASFHSSYTSRWHVNFYHPQFAWFFFCLNDSSNNKCLDFKIPFWNVSTTIPFSDLISAAHCAWILSCSGSRVGILLRVWLIFPTFWLFSPILFTTFRTWFGLPHPSIVSIPRGVCTHPIDLGFHN